MRFPVASAPSSGGSVTPEALAALGVYVPVRVEISAAQIAAAHVTRVDLVPDPGADKLVSIQRINFVLTGREGVASPIGNFTVSWPGLFGSESAITPGTFTFQAADSWAAVNGVEPIEGDSPIDLSDVVNQPVQFGCSTEKTVYGGIGAGSGIAAAGSDWVVNDTFTVDGGVFDPTLAIGVVDSVVNGEITAYHITTNANGYLIGTSNITATSGIGSGAALDVTDLDYSVNPLKIVAHVKYDIIDCAP